MTDDTEDLDTPRFSKRECQEFVKDAIAMAVERTAERIYYKMRSEEPPHWRRDIVYVPGEIIRHNSRYWQAEKHTQSVPSDHNQCWQSVRRVKGAIQ